MKPSVRACSITLAHHRGQLTIYLRRNGETVSAIYDPLADEGKV
jgi:uncharacterized damage-inducible protein DinB